jgi:hypothetical protein
LDFFQEFKGGGRFPGDKDYSAPLYPETYTLLPLQRYFVYEFPAVGGFYLYTTETFFQGYRF